MLATLTDKPFSDPDWVFERKLDGVRCLAFRDGGAVRLLSRNRKPLTDRYPELVLALERQRTARFIVDGEIVAFKDGVSSFERLQGRLGLADPVRARATGIPVFYLSVRPALAGGLRHYEARAAGAEASAPIGALVPGAHPLQRAPRRRRGEALP